MLVDLLGVSSNTFLPCLSTHNVWRFPRHKNFLRFLSAAVQGKATGMGEREKRRRSNVTASLSNMQEPVSWQRCVHHLSNHYQCIKHKSSLWGACAHGQTPKAGAVRESVLGLTASSPHNANLQLLKSVLGLILSLAMGQRNIIPFSCASARMSCWQMLQRMGLQ